jgi:hypothetical protein
MRGKTMSSANFVWPVHFARASTLRKGLPTTLSGFPFFPLVVIQLQTTISSVRSKVIYRQAAKDAKNAKNGKG